MFCYLSAPRVANVLAAIEHIYPLVEKYNAGPPRGSSSNDSLKSKRQHTSYSNVQTHHQHHSYKDDDESFDSDDEDDIDSDESQD